MNNLQDLNMVLFNQLDALDNPDMTDDEIQRQVTKTDAIVKVAGRIIENAKLALDAQKQFDEFGTGRTVDIPLLGISNEGLAAENKSLRRRLMQKENYD